MDTKPVYVFARWQVKDGALEQVLNLLATVTKASAAEEGNIFYKVHQSNTDAHTLLLSECYTDEVAVEAHRNTAHFQDIVIGQIIPMLDNREVILASQLDFREP